MTNPEYQIVPRTPSVDDYLRLRAAGGLTAFSREAAEIGLKGTLFSVVVLYQGGVVGMGRLIGDGGCFFQITDISLEATHRGQGLGKAVISALMAHIHANLLPTAYVSLIADLPANRLYEQFGFNDVAPRSLGMAYRLA